MTQSSTKRYGLPTNDASFGQDVLQSKGVSIVDFWAEWCGPCRTLSPTIDEIARENEGKVSVFKLDVDANPETPTKYGIRGIPTVLFFKDGELVDQLVGAHPKDALLKKIAQHQS